MLRIQDVLIVALTAYIRSTAQDGACHDLLPIMGIWLPHAARA